MGERGAKLSSAAEATARWAEDELAPLGAVSARKMFGGFGVFSDGVMFALVDSRGDLYYRTDERTQMAYAGDGSVKHSGMPYWTVPDEVLADIDRLRAWAEEALAAARRAKKL
jgi:DNA transformation protein